MSCTCRTAWRWWSRTRCGSARRTPSSISSTSTACPATSSSATTAPASRAWCRAARRLPGTTGPWAGSQGAQREGLRMAAGDWLWGRAGPVERSASGRRPGAFLSVLVLGAEKHGQWQLARGLSWLRVVWPWSWRTDAAHSVTSSRGALHQPVRPNVPFLSGCRSYRIGVHPVDTILT